MNPVEFKNFSDDVFQLHLWMDRILVCTKLCIEFPSAALTNGKTNWNEYPEKYQSFRIMMTEQNRFNKRIECIDKCVECFKENPNVESLTQIVQFTDLLKKETENWSKQKIITK